MGAEPLCIHTTSPGGRRGRTVNRFSCQTFPFFSFDSLQFLHPIILKYNMGLELITTEPGGVVDIIRRSNTPAARNRHGQYPRITK
jgi:hypothetical protein